MEPTQNQASPENLGAAAARKPAASRSAKTAGLNPENSNSTDTAASAASDSAATTETSALSGAQDALSSVVASGKKWLDESHLLDQAGQLPQQARAYGQQALSRVGALSTTQKVVGISLLTAGIAFLATRGKRRKNEESEYRAKPRRSPFEGRKSDAGYGPGPGEQRGRYGAGSSAGGSGRVSSGSSYGAGRHDNDFGKQAGQGGASGSYGGSGSGSRRDQGPGRYDARTGGRQNPNVDDDTLAF